MKTHLFVLDSATPMCAAAHAVSLIGAVLVGLTGCADTHWERAFYEGARFGSAQCQLNHRPADAPCTELLDYDRYEQERAKAKNATPSSTQSPAIEEKQP